MTKPFDEIAPRLVRELMDAFHLTKAQAAGIVGNLAHESAGFTVLHEIGHPDRGIGWAQWTGPRHNQYVAYCQHKKLDPASYEANKGFLFQELSGPYARAISAVRQANTCADAAVAFEKSYERAGIPRMESRLAWANKAMVA